MDQSRRPVVRLQDIHSRRQLDSLEIYHFNTIANYDLDITPFLDSRVNSTCGRDNKAGLFVEEEFDQE